MDLNGNLQWCNEETISPYYEMKEMIYVSSSEYLVMGNYYDPGPSVSYNDLVTMRINSATGAIISSSPRINYFNANIYIDDLTNVAQGRNNVVYATGRTYINGADMGSMRVFLTKFDIAGNHLFSNYLQFHNTQSARMYGSDIIYDDDSLLISYFGDINGSSGNFSVGLIKTDTLGNVVWSKDYNISSGSYEMSRKLLKTGYGYALIGYVNYSNNTKDFFIIALNRQGNLLWAKSYGSSGFDEDMDVYFPRVATNDAVNDDNIYFTGYSNQSGTKNLVIAKVDSLGNVSCLTSANLAVTQSNTPTNTTVCPMTFYTNTVTASPITQISNGAPSDGCISYNSPNLGADTSFCNSFSLPLDATASGATQYQWSNGATTSSITATTAGTYTVAVHFNCCIKTDTIVITSGMTSSTQSYSICSGDSVLVGNTYYSEEGTYVDTINNKSGCMVITTTNIIVNQSPATPVVAANGSVLSTGNALTYQWYLNGVSIGGATSQFYTVTQNGFYQVTITDANGCSAMSQPFNYNSTSIGENIFSGKITVYPNPSGGLYSVDVKGTTAKELIVKVQDALGREVCSEKMKTENGACNKEISLSNFRRGIYFLHIQADKSSCVIKLVKN